MISYLSCIRILGGVVEILLLQPGFLLFRLRDVDALDLEDDRPRTVIATGDHHPVVVGPPLHDGPSLQGCVHIPADGIPRFPAELAVHQVIEVILLGRPFEQEGVPFLEERARPGMGIGQVFLLVIREALGLQHGYLALVFHLKMRFGMQRYAFMVGFPSRSGEDFQADDGGDQRRDEEQPPETGGFLEYQDADKDGPHGADACPYWIGRPDRDRLTRLGEKKHAEG